MTVWEWWPLERLSVMLPGKSAQSTPLSCRRERTPMRTPLLPYGACPLSASCTSPTRSSTYFTPVGRTQKMGIFCVKCSTWRWGGVSAHPHCKQLCESQPRCSRGRGAKKTVCRPKLLFRVSPNHVMLTCKAVLGRTGGVACLGASVHDEEEWRGQPRPFTTRRSGLPRRVRSRRGGVAWSTASVHDDTPARCKAERSEASRRE